MNTVSATPPLIPAAVLVRAFTAGAAINPREQALLRAALNRRRQHAEGAYVGDPETGATPCLIVAGLVGLCFDLPDGRRQICALRLPGDPLGFPCAMDAIHRLAPVALTKVETLSCPEIPEAIARGEAPTLAQAVVRHDQMEAAHRLAQIVRLGRLSALERTADLILELHRRMRAVGLADAHQLPWPLTQLQLADLLGLSSVHINRVLQQLKVSGAIRYRRGRMVVPDLANLRRLAGQDTGDAAAPAVSAGGLGLGA